MLFARLLRRFIQLNDKKINFTQADASYLLKQNYDQAFLDEVYALEEISQLQLQSYTSLDSSKSYRVEYVDNAQFRRIAKFLKIMEDLKEGVPRTAYLGVVYGNFDIILDHFSRISQLQPNPHALWAVFYLVPRLTSCRLVLAIRWYTQFGASGRCRTERPPTVRQAQESGSISPRPARGQATSSTLGNE